MKLIQSLQNSKLPQGHWDGRLASSALSTATAVSAFSILLYGPICPATQQRIRPPDNLLEAQKNEIELQIQQGCGYILAQQNEDGGWGDTDRSSSNISTTLLCIAALKLAKHDTMDQKIIDNAWRYVDSHGRWNGLTRRYGKDKTFAVPILTNCALAGLVPWKDVPALPFEAAALPQSWYRFIQLPVVSYAIPALVAIGQVREHFLALKSPLRWPIRKLAIKPSLQVLARMQPASGGYLEAIPLTSFVLMSLAAKGLAQHDVSSNAVGFLLSSVREDGSWPIDTNLATWVTSLTINAVLSSNNSNKNEPNVITQPTIDWLLSCQHLQKHPFTGAEPGGWGWSNLSGAVPDADDTPCALLALHKWHIETQQNILHHKATSTVATSVQSGVRWLVDLQNRDGGWPTFCRGWGTLPFDRSGNDLTAHAIRAIHHWHQSQISNAFDWVCDKPESIKLLRQIPLCLERGWRYLERHQSKDGCWLPLWFGNQDEVNEANPIYGTARVLLAYAECKRVDSIAANHAIEFLQGKQNCDGGWGGGVSVRYHNSNLHSPNPSQSTVEETAQAIEALSACGLHDSDQVQRGVDWLCNAIEQDFHQTPQPIGFYFAKLWYYEAMYPIVYSLAALNRFKQQRPNSISAT